MDDHPIEDDGDDRPHHSYSDGDETAENAADKHGAGVDNSAGARKPADDENPGAEDGNLSSGENPTDFGENLAATNENLAAATKLSHQNWEEVAAHVSVVHPAKTAKRYKNCMKTLKTAYKLFADAGGRRLVEKLYSIYGGTDAAPQLTTKIPTKAGSVRNHEEKSENLSEDLPPPEKRRRVEEESPAGNLARVIEGFAEAYEKVEMEKMKQAAEMGKQWRIIMKDFESEWIKFCKKTQEEINKLNNK